MFTHEFYEIQERLTAIVGDTENTKNLVLEINQAVPTCPITYLVPSMDLFYHLQGADF